MAPYEMIGTKDLRGDVDTIVATHVAQPGTYVVYAHKDLDHSRAPVLLWGVLHDGTPVPITIGGVWDGTSNGNKFVLYPDGSCANFDRDWANLEQAVEDMRQHAPD